MQALDCDSAIEKIMTYLDDADRHRGEVERALNHISECPDCERRVGHLVRALATAGDDTLTCRECEEFLPDYLQADLEGGAGAPLWRRVRLHLETCPHCAAAYATLSDLSALAYRERGTEPPHYPGPELSFLSKGQSGVSKGTGKPWRVDALGQLIIQFSAEMVRAWQAPGAQPAHAKAGLKSSKSPGVSGQLSITEAVEDLKVTITTESQRDDPDRCIVVVKVDIPSRGGWPNLADTEVRLKRTEQELEIQATDAHGEVVFEGIATDDLAQLAFEITPGKGED